MEHVFRHTDFLFRYGGEEFVVIMNNCSHAGALQALERFRQTVESYQFPSNRVTVSIGYTVVNPNLPTAKHLENADKALYHAKYNGRNQIQEYVDTDQFDKDAEDDVELF
jgi:diguanylate cyclase (GGDEF)-like protein